MKLIGIEEHFLTGEVRDAWHAKGLAATDPMFAFGGLWESLGEGDDMVETFAIVTMSGMRS